MIENAQERLAFLTQNAEEIADMKKRITPQNRAERRKMEKLQRRFEKQLDKAGMPARQLQDMVMERFIEKLEEKMKDGIDIRETDI